MPYADPNDFEPVSGGTAVADPADFEVVAEQANPSDFEVVSSAVGSGGIVHTGLTRREGTAPTIDASEVSTAQRARDAGRPVVVENGRVVIGEAPPQTETTQALGERMAAPLITLPKPENAGVISGAVRGIENVAEGLTTRENIAIGLALPGAGKVIQKIAAAGFGAMMAKQLPEQIQAGIDAPTAGEKAEKFTEAAAGAALAVLAVKHATETGTRMTAAERAQLAKVAPRTAAAVELSAPMDAKAAPVSSPGTVGDVRGAEPISVETQSQEPPVAPATTDAARLAATPELPASSGASEEPVALAGDGKPPVSAVPKLREGQTQGDLLGGSEDLTLVGEKVKAEAAKPAEKPLTIQQTVNEALDAYGDAASAHEHLGNQIEALSADKKNKPTVDRLRAAQRHIENALEAEHRRSEEAQQAQEDSGKYDLMESVKELGGLPAATSKHAKDATGELNRIKESRKGATTTLFRKNAGSLDTLREALGERGFQFDDFHQMLDAIESANTSGKPTLGSSFPEGYRGGPGAMGPVEKAQFDAERKILSGRNADVEASQIRRGQEPTVSEARKEDPVTFENAMNAIEKDPSLPEKLVESIHADPSKPITDEQQQMLTYRRAELENKMAAESERAVDHHLSAEERWTAQTNAELLESQLLRAEQANRMAGTASGRSLRSRQIEMHDDYTFAGISYRERKRLGRELTKEESEVIRHQADEISKAQEKSNAADLEAQAIEEASDTDAHVTKLQEEIDRLNKAEEVRPKFGEKVLEHARKVVEKWEAEAAEVDADLKDFFGSESGAVGGVGGPKGEGKNLRGEAKRAAQRDAVTKLAKVIRAKVGRFGLKQAETLTALVIQYGEGVRPFFSKAWAEMTRMVDSEFKDKPAKVKEAVKKGEGAPSPEKSRDVVSRAKAEAVAVEPLSHKTVYEIAEAHVKSGLRGTDAVMKATHETVKEAYPDATERDVRRAFTEYGKAKFPSKDAVKTELRNIRTAARLKESIDRIEKDAQDPLRTGVQRDKMNLEARALQKQLNELLKKRQGPPSPEKLASREDAKITALQNRIADIDKILRTGEKPEKGAPMPDSVKTEQLKAELGAMKEKLKEIEDAKNPPPPEHEVELKRLQDRVDETRDRLARMELTRPKAEGKPTADTAEIAAAKAELKTLNDTIRELRKPVPLSDAQKALDSALVARERAAQTLDDISTGKLKANTPAGKAALTQLEEDIRSETDSMKQLAAEMRRDAKPKTDPGYAKEQAQIRALEKAIERYAEKTAKGDFTTTGKQLGPDSRRVAQLKEIRDSRRSMYETARDAGKPVRSPEERYNDTRMKALTKREAELAERLRTGNFAPKPKKIQPKLERAALDATVRVEKLKAEVDKGHMEAERANRTKFQKFTAAVANLNRINILSHISVLEHLTGAAVENIATRPVGTALAQVMRFSKTLDAIRRKAAYEGRISAKSEFAGITGTIKSSRALWEKLRTGKSDIDWLNSKKNYPKEFGEIVGNVHGAIKEPVRQGIYSRSLQLRIEAAEEMGLNPAGDKVLRDTLSAEAYRDANMDIFMGDNFLTKALHNNVNAYLRGQKGDPGLAKFTADALDILFPIVNVSTNIAIRKFRLAAGLPEAGVRLGSAALKGELKGGAAKLTERDAELITKSFKYGAFGAALAIYAWNNPQQFGGIYVSGKQAPRDKTTGLGLGEIALPGGGHISHHLAHGPVGGYLNQIADARRLYDKEVRDHPESRWSAATEAAFFSMFSGAKDLPAFSTIARLSSPFKSAGAKAGELLRNMLIPGLVQDTASALDKKDRTAKNFTEQMKMGVPGLRGQLPEKKEK